MDARIALDPEQDQEERRSETDRNDNNATEPDTRTKKSK